MRRHLPTVLLSLAATAALPARLPAQTAAPAPSVETYAAAIEAGRQVITTVMAEQGIPGMSVALAMDGWIVWSEGFGLADLEHGLPVTPLTRFRIGSISKAVTAGAIGVLLRRQQLDLDAPVQEYVPSFPEKRWTVTTRQIAGHLAGIRHYRGDEMMSAKRYPTVSSGLAIFQDDSLLFEPGTRYAYSSYGWNLVSAVVEGASGQEFLTFMRREVFEPLGLRSIIAEHTDSLIAYRASFYTRTDNGTTLNAPYVDNSYKWAGGGYISNAEDLVRYASAYLGDAFLDPATIAQLFSSQTTAAGEPTRYGIGWRSGSDGGGRRWVGHTGGSVGGRAVLLLYPEQRLAIAALANLGSAPMSVRLAQRLAGPFFVARQAAQN